MPVSTVAATAASATQAAAKSSLADEQLAGRAPTTALGFGRTCVTARPREGTERLSSFFSLMEAVATIPLGPTAVTDPRWPSSFVPSLSTMVEECRTAAMGRVVMTPFAFANVAPTRENATASRSSPPDDVTVTSLFPVYLTTASLAAIEVWALGANSLLEQPGRSSAPIVPARPAVRKPRRFAIRVKRTHPFLLERFGKADYAPKITPPERDVNRCVSPIYAFCTHHPSLLPPRPRGAGYAPSPA